MKKRIVKSARMYTEIFQGKHRFEHWYVSNQVYFITSRCREKFPAFASDPAKQVFWDRFYHWAGVYQFEPWVTTVMNNHYHTLGFLRHGQHLQSFMQRFHGSVAKLVNDLLPERRKEFWRDGKGREYFDGCIRDETQCRSAYRYTMLQAVRAGIVKRWSDYPHTHLNKEVDACVTYANTHHGFLDDIPYKRYQK